MTQAIFNQVCWRYDSFWTFTKTNKQKKDSVGESVYSSQAQTLETWCYLSQIEINAAKTK